MASISTPTSASTSPESPIPDLLAVFVQRTMGVFGSETIGFQLKPSRNDLWAPISFIDSWVDVAMVWILNKTSQISSHGEMHSRSSFYEGLVPHISVDNYGAVLVLQSGDLAVLLRMIFAFLVLALHFISCNFNLGCFLNLLNKGDELKRREF
ncbi:unnamed protein product [Cercopithifilaria johnstoni]|uniref:Uncharacterized protein n=1 Tax=Cercopithifilaria johnstoni TaxID=2874296 RepID=A0A8J2M369_9BILA|nr:unnamed protein product [Cercopithifilaria johnstoni]